MLACKFLRDSIKKLNMNQLCINDSRKLAKVNDKILKYSTKLGCDKPLLWEHLFEFPNIIHQETYNSTFCVSLYLRSLLTSIHQVTGRAMFIECCFYFIIQNSLPNNPTLNNSILKIY